MARKQIDSKYIKDLKEGNEEAFDYIYEYYHNDLYFFSLSLVKNHAEAEEIVQESFINVITKIKSLRDVNSFHAWLFRLTYNVAMTNYRKNIKAVENETPLFDTHFEVNETTNSSYNDIELYNAIVNAIRNLPSKYLRIAQLYYLQELTTREIAKVLSIPQSTVSYRVKAIEQKLQEDLTIKGYSPEKYYSLALLPLLASVMKELSLANVMNQQVSLKIKESIKTKSTKQVKGVSLSHQIAVNGFLSSKLAILLGIFVLCIVSYFVLPLLLDVDESITNVEAKMYEKSSRDFKYIDRIYYDEDPVRDTVKVSIELNKNANGSDVSIVKEDTTLPFIEDGSHLQFDANENGNYQIKVKKDDYTLKIKNIDKTVPIIQDIKYKKKELQLIIDDQENRINYQKSYALFEGEKIKIDEVGVLKGNYKGQIQLYLYDTKAGVLHYEVTI